MWPGSGQILPPGPCSCHCLLGCPCGVQLCDLLIHGFLDLCAETMVCHSRDNTWHHISIGVDEKWRQALTWSWICTKSLSRWTWLP